MLSVEGKPRSVSNVGITIFDTPVGAYEQASRGLRHAAGNGGVYYHYCFLCGGWIKGPATYVVYSSLTGWQGQKYHCERCGKNIHTAKQVHRGRFNYWWRHSVLAGLYCILLKKVHGFVDA